MKLKTIKIAGCEILPVIEGGKGINVSNGLTSGLWAECGGMGTFSGVNPDFYDANGEREKPVFKGKSRAEKQDELLAFGIRGCLDQARRAYEASKGRGLIAMNILWEQGRAQDLLEGVLSRAQGLIRAISCGAGMPFKLGEIAAKYKTFYNPIISSARALQLLWKRSYSQFKEYLGAVVYEDPWLAGGHNGISGAESVDVPQKPWQRIAEIRKFMNEVGLKAVPIIIAGGIWWLSEWLDYMDNDEIGPVGFQFGTRPMVTIESPLSEHVKKKLMSVGEGEVRQQKFSPTGLYSSAVRNDFLRGLEEALARQIPFETEAREGFDVPLELSINGKTVYIAQSDRAQMAEYMAKGFNRVLKTPSNTLLFVTEARFGEIMQDMKDCVGCLSACLFSGWDQRGTLGIAPDPRSFCIQRSLQELSHGGNGENQLLFSGKNAYRFKDDPFYRGGTFIPTVKQLFDRILTGN